MKKLFLFCVVLLVSCFAQLEVITSKSEGKSGFFFGAGIGVAANMMRFVGQSHPVTGSFYDEKKTYAALVLSAKVGGYYAFTNLIALRYYYNLDFNLNPTGGESEPNSPIETFYFLSGSHTLNTDAIVSVFASKDFKVDVLAGMGMGLLAGEYGPRYKTVYKPADRSNFIDFEFRFNLGTRVMFAQKYGIELMMKLPVTPAVYVYGSDASRYGKFAPYYFTLDFVMERF